METSLHVYDYPEPIDAEEKTITAKVVMTFDLEFPVPKKWDRYTIEEYIKEDLKNLDRYDETIEEIFINDPNDIDLT